MLAFRALSLALLVGAGCATRLPGEPDEPAPPSPDLRMSHGDLGEGAAHFAGTFLWDSANSDNVRTNCDNGGSAVDPPPMGGVRLAPGPGAEQVNIGVGTTACPIFIWDVLGATATLANIGTTCPSGPGF